MKVLKFVAVVTLLVAPVFARLGETEQQLLARFGPPTSRSKHTVMAQGKVYDLGPSMNFKQGDWSIGCELVDGRCARIFYSKAGEWTEEHVQTVINANSQGGTWVDLTKPGSKKMVREWKRSDGAVAKWVIGKMTITVPAYDRAVAVVEAKAKAAASRPAKI